MRDNQCDVDNLVVGTLSHPGREVLDRTIGNSGVMEWRMNKHGRKFLTSPGKYATAQGGSYQLASDQTELLMFWGEWEAQSKCAQIEYPAGRPAADMPENVHKPLCMLPPPFGALNTDPYVFGKTFYYSNCQQRGRRLKLPNNSMLIFGTGVGAGMEFKVDTVFVVGESKAYTVGKTDLLDVSVTFREVVLNRLTGGAACGPGNVYRLYSGRMFAPNCNDVFSYVPCKPANVRGVPAMFARPVIDFGSNEYKELLLRADNPPVNLRRSAYLVEGGDLDRVRALWSQLTHDILASGVCLGVYLEEPTVCRAGETGRLTPLDELNRPVRCSRCG